MGGGPSYTASYDAVGNPTRMTDPEGVDVFVYDALDRLTEDKRYLPDGTTLVSDELYTYNALGALKTNANVVLDDQRPKLAGGGTADAAVPATLNGQPVTLNAGGFVTSLNGTSFSWSERGFLRQAQDPVPAALEHYIVDGALRRVAKTQSGVTEFYVFEDMDRIAVLNQDNTLREGYLFDGVDHPLRITQSATTTTAYYELDLAGNVRHLFASGGTDLGGYRYTAFGKTVEDTTTITQPLRWKGRWFSSGAGGIYDVRARQWAPEMGVFLAVDEFPWHDATTTLWGWTAMSPARWRDASGRRRDPCDSNSTNCGGIYSPPPPPWPPPPPPPPEPPVPPPPAPPQPPPPPDENYCRALADDVEKKRLDGDPSRCPPVPGKPPQVCLEVWARTWARCMGLPYVPLSPGSH